MRIGAHLSVAKGFDKAVMTAWRLGCETFQVFSRSPRGGKAREIGDTEMAQMRHNMLETGIEPIVIHVPYLVNLASSEEKIREYGITVVREDLQRARYLGAPFVVTHPGSFKGPTEAGLERLAESLRLLLDYWPEEIMLLLETMAGTGNELGYEFSQLGTVIDRLGRDERLGVCLDTCHAFASGYELRTVEGINRTLDELDECIGLDRLRVVHLNDSRFPLGSKKDRHEHIGKGFIGLEGFRRFLKNDRVSQLPMILETPVGDESEYVSEIETIKRIRD